MEYRQRRFVILNLLILNVGPFDGISFGPSVLSSNSNPQGSSLVTAAVSSPFSSNLGFLVAGGYRCRFTLFLIMLMLYRLMLAAFFCF